MPIGVYKRTEKIKSALSKARLGVAPWNKGLKIDRERYPTMGHHVVHSKATREKMIKNHKGMAGKRHSKVTILKMVNAQKGRSQPCGELSSHWKGGGRKYRCAQVLKRDNFTCQTCGLRDTDIMQVDHRIERSVGGDDSMENLQTLCPNCHARKTVAFLKRKRIK